MKLLFLGLISSVISLAGCADPSGPLAPKLPPSQLLASITIDVGSAIVAVGDSIDLKAVALSITKDTLPIEGNSLEWGVSDASMLRVNQNGRVYVLRESAGTIVYPWVRWTSNGVTRADSSYFVITQNRDPVASIQIRPQGDSVRTGLPGSGTCCGVSIIARNAAGDSLGLIRAPLVSNPEFSQSQLIISYLGPLGIQIGSGQYLVGSRVIGPFWLMTEAVVYGTLMRDSIQMMGLYPPSTNIRITANAISGEITSVSNGFTKIVQPCGAIEFNNRMTQPIEVIFDDTSKVSGCVPGDPKGNIDSIARNATISRKIPLGTVRWTARVKGSDPSSPTISGTVTTREP